MGISQVSIVCTPAFVINLLGMICFFFDCPFVLFVFSDGGQCLIWVVGHSFVHWGGKRAGVRPNGRQLGLSRSEAQVRWLGVRGLRWSRLLPVVQYYASLDRAPDILVVHAGGNDLGSRSSRELLRDIKLDFLRLWSSYPGLLIVWSDITARRVWRNARSPQGLNRARAKLNKAVGKFVARNGGFAVRHRELEEVDVALLEDDGVHPTGIGYDIWALGLRGGVERALEVWRDEQA